MFVVKFVLPGKEAEEPKKKEEPKKNEDGEVIVEAEVDTVPEEFPYTLVDNDNGSYTVKYKMETEVDNLAIHIYYQDSNGQQIQIRGSPFTACHKFGVPAKNNELNGPSMIQNMTNQIKDVESFI